MIIHIYSLREINSHHNYNTSTFFSSNENLAFLVMKTLNLVETAFQQYKMVVTTIYIVIRTIYI